MGKINTGRVILGGLLAGLVVNIGETILNKGIIGKDWEEAMKALGKGEGAMSMSMIATFVALGFFLGIVILWVYAAIRSRYGAGPRTAIWAGLMTWLLAVFYPSVGWIVLDIFPARLIAIGGIWSFFEIPIAAVVGAWAYKEEG